MRRSYLRIIFARDVCGRVAKCARSDTMRAKACGGRKKPMAVKTKSRRPGGRRCGSGRRQASARFAARQGPAGRSRRLRRADLDRAVAIAHETIVRHQPGNQRHRHTHRSGHRGVRPSGLGDHRRQRQHAVPFQFRARRGHRKRRRADAGHPSGRAGPARQDGRRRDPCRRRARDDGGDRRQPHPGACRRLSQDRAEG